MRGHRWTPGAAWRMPPSRGAGPWARIASNACGMEAAAPCGKPAMMAPPPREQLRVERQHGCAHGSTCGEARDEHPGGIEVMVTNHGGNHRGDGCRLTAVSRSVFGREPIEAEARIVGPALLRIENRESFSLAMARPAGSLVIATGRLTATMKHDDETGARGRLWRKSQGVQRPGIGTWEGKGKQPPALSRGLVEPSRCGKSCDSVSQSYHHRSFKARSFMLQCSMWALRYALQRADASFRGRPEPRPLRHGLRKKRLFAVSD